MKKTKHFKIYELVCQDVYKRDGENAFRYFRPVLLDFIDWLRESINKPVYVNNWFWGGPHSQRGLRCNLCPLVANNKKLYLSAHITGSGIDFNVKDIDPDQLHAWLESNFHKFFYLHPEYIMKCRIESKEFAPTWVHVDFYEHDAGGIVQYIKPLSL